MPPASAVNSSPKPPMTFQECIAMAREAEVELRRGDGTPSVRRLRPEEHDVQSAGSEVGWLPVTG
jgi:hypothetical protein